MPVTLTQAQLSDALRLTDSTEEIAEAARLLSYATVAVSRHLGDSYSTTPDAVLDEATIRLAGYLFDQPNAGRGLMYADALRSSGAAMILLPFKVIRAGSTGALAAAQAAMGSATNPVVDVVVSTADRTITVSFEDGSTHTNPLPADMGGTLDQTARDAAAGASTAAGAAQATADQAQTAADEANATAGAAQSTAGAASSAAGAASSAAGAAQATADDAGAAAAGASTAAVAAQTTATAAQGAIAAHELTPHNTDGTARTAAATAQARADDAYTLADGKVDAAGAASAVRSHGDIVNVLDGRLPGPPVAMRLGWSQTPTFTVLDFNRPPMGGSVAGMSDGLAAPPFPPALDTDPTLYLGLWLAGDPEGVEIRGAEFGVKRALTVNGVAGVYRVSAARLGPLAGTVISVTIPGPRIVTEANLAAHANDPDAHHTPPAGGGTDQTARDAAAAAQAVADAAAAAIPRRTTLYADSADYTRLNASPIFRQLTLMRAPARGRGLELLIHNVGTDVRAPLDCGTTDDWLDAPALSSTQLGGLVTGNAVTVSGCIEIKSVSFNEDDSDDFGHGIMYVGRVTDTLMAVAFSQNRGLNQRFRMTAREVP